MVLKLWSGHDFSRTIVKSCVCHSFLLSIEGRMWDVILLIPDHCLSIYFDNIGAKIAERYDYICKICCVNVTRDTYFSDHFQQFNLS